MHFKKITLTATFMLAASMAMAEPAPKAVDLSKLYGRFEKSGYSSLELMETTKQVLISGVALGVSQSFSNNSIFASRRTRKLAGIREAHRCR